MKKRIFIALMSALLLLTVSSCADKKADDIVISYETPADAAGACGLTAIDFVPEGYNVLSYNSVFGFVYETEYISEKINDTEDEMSGLAVLRVVDSQYNVSNLSGFLDTASAEIYTTEDGKEFEIKTRDGVYMCEWNQTLGDSECNISYTVFGNGFESKDEALDNYKDMLDELLENI